MPHYNNLLLEFIIVGAETLVWNKNVFSLTFKTTKNKIYIRPGSSKVDTNDAQKLTMKYYKMNEL